MKLFFYNIAGQVSNKRILKKISIPSQSLYLQKWSPAILQKKNFNKKISVAKDCTKQLMQREHVITLQLEQDKFNSVNIIPEENDLSENCELNYSGLTNFQEQLQNEAIESMGAETLNVNINCELENNVNNESNLDTNNTIQDAIEEFTNATNFNVSEICVNVLDNKKNAEFNLPNHQENEASDGSKCKFKSNFMDFIKNDDDLIAFTGISSQLLNSLTKIVEMSEGINSKKFVNSPKVRIVMCLIKLKLNLSFQCLSTLFKITRQTCKNIFVYMINLLLNLLEKVIYWPTDDEMIESLPTCFKKYSNTRVVLDCTEIPVEKPGCLKCRLKLYSHYKGLVFDTNMPS